MNQNDNLPPPPHPEWEARVVAWVLGEASAFEIAELTRLAAENPEIAAFKQNIEAMHGLVSEAARPPRESLLLSPERRAKLLATIGASPSANAPFAASATVRLPRRKMTWRAWWPVAIAACATLGIFLFTERMKPEFSARSSQTNEKQEAVALPTLLANEEKAKAGTQFGLKALAEKEQVDKIEASANAAPNSSTYRSYAAPVPLLKQTQWKKTEQKFAAEIQRDTRVETEPPATAAREGSGADGSLALDPEPFVVTGDADQGYAAVNTLAGSRVRSDLTDLTPKPEFSIGSLQGTIAETSSAGNSSDGLEVASNRPVERQKPAIRFDDRVDSFGREGTPAEISSAPASPVDSNEKIVLSPFVVDAKDKVEFRADTLGGSRVATDLKDVSSAITVVTAQFLKDTGGKNASDLLNYTGPAEIAGVAGKFDQPAPEADMPVPHAAPPADDSLRLELNARTAPISTFSLHVSDVSFELARAALERGEVPDPASIRPEEFYNAFDYGDPAPAAGEAVNCRVEQAAHPFLQQRNLVRIALKIPATGRSAVQPLRLTVLLDTSGSMEREDRTASVRRAMAVLASLLTADDRVTLIGFARQPHLLAEQIPGNEAAKLVEIIGHTPAEGGTNLEEALKLAGNYARAQFNADAQNRIVILSDGAANLGNDDPAQLAMQVATLRQQGIALDACGVGADGLDDSILEALTRKGDGRYYVLNSPAEADANFARQLAGAFRPAAKNVKVQVRFNPTRVRSYRLIGFEQHRLKTEDFRNDQVDAAELAAAEAAVAVYQIEPMPEGEGELGDVFVRFRNVATDQMVERSWTLTYDAHAPAFDRSTPTMQLAGTAALLAVKLQGGPAAAPIRLSELVPVVDTLRQHFEKNEAVQELVKMFAQARRLTAE